MILMLLSVPCWLCGYKNIFHVILPAKIQGLGGVKLDRPLNRKNAIREGDHYNVSCENTPFKSIRAEVVEKKGKSYVRSIHAEPRQDFGYILSLLKEKYGEPEYSSTSSTSLFGDDIESKNYFFKDWRSWNCIMVSVTRYYKKGRPVGYMGTYPPDTEINTTVDIHAYGQLKYEQINAEIADDKARRNRDLNSL